MYRKITINYKFTDDEKIRTTEATLTNEDPYTDGDYKLTYYEPANARYITTHYGKDLPTPADMTDDALYEITRGNRRCVFVEIEGATAWIEW